MASRNVFFFFELLFWPIVGVLSIGLMTRFLHLTPEQASFVLIGTIALSVVNVCQLEVAYAVLLDVWSKSLKHQFLAPIGIRHLTLGSWLVGMARGGALFLLLAALARSAVSATLAHWCFFAALQRARRTGLLLKMSE